MQKNYRRIRRHLCILLLVCIVSTFPIVTVPVFAAEGTGVTVTNVPSMLWGGLGQYVEYEMDGIKYRTDTASSAINRLAWSRMTQEDRRKTYDRLFTTAARKAAFGEDGFADIVSWIRETNEWFKANRLWKDRIANRDYPELHAVFSDSASLSTVYSDWDTFRLYSIPQNVPPRKLEVEEFDRALADVELNYGIGRQFYQKVVDMHAKNIGAAVSFTIMQCTQMLSDMLFVPSVVQGASVATSGMFADVTNVLLQVVGLDGGSIAEKVNKALEGESVQLTVGEQIKLRAAVIDTYVILAQRSKNDMDASMNALRAAHTKIEELSQAIEYYDRQLELEKQQAKKNYQTNLDETLVSPTPTEPGESDEVYSTLAFMWKTEAELKRDLFHNNFNEWLSENSIEDGYAYPQAAELVFAEVLAQKAVLDQEVAEKVDIICDKIKTAYTNANGKVEALEAELGGLQNQVNSNLPEDETDLIRVPVGDTFFYGTEVFAPELENYANSGRAYDDYFQELQAHISEYKTKVADLLASVKALKDGTSGFYGEIEKDVQDVMLYLDLLDSLAENYSTLYLNAVWKLYNDSGQDIDPNYDQIPFINPYHDDEGAYHTNGFEVAVDENHPPAGVYTPDALAVTRPTGVYDQAYTLYQELSDMEEELDSAYSASFQNDAAYKAGRTKYYEEMDNWLLAYKTLEQKMANALGKIKSITDAYEASWDGTFFLGSYDYISYQPYLYNTGLVSVSAFDVAGLREHIRGGGNTSSLYTKLKDIERKAEINEAVAADLIGQIGALNIEMEQMRDDTLDNYAVSKGMPCKNFYSLRSEYGLDDRWGNLTRSSDDVLAYFNTCDIPQICDILQGETDDVVFMQNAIKEIRGYLDADTVATVPVSNRLYDIYRKATGIKDIYTGGTYNNYGLLTEAQHTELLYLYANPNDADDIYNTMNSVRYKHEDVSYTYPPSPHDGVDQFGPVGEPTSTAAFPGTMAVQAPIYHPLAVEAKSITATLYVYDAGWSKVQTLSGTEDLLDGIIDTGNDMLRMSFTGLEDGRDYRVDWDIVHAPYGTAEHEEGNYYFTYTAPVGVFTTVELNEETYDSASVAVTNNSGEVLSDKYVYLDGYDEDENLVLSQKKTLSPLDTGQTTTLEFTFDDAVYTVEACVEGEGGQRPGAPVRLEVEGGDSIIAVPGVGEAANDSVPFTATVYDQYGEVYEGGTIDWSLSPQTNGVSIGQDGVVTVTSAARNVISDDLICTVTATLRGTTVSGTKVFTTTIDIVSEDVVVDWTAVEDMIGSASYTYGDRDDKAGPLGEGAAAAGDIPLQGTFSYKDPEGIRNSGEQVITVIFTVTTAGDYQGLQLEHDVAVTVTKRGITGTLMITGKGAVGEMLTAVFTSEIGPEEYAIVWLSGGSPVVTAPTYTVAAGDRGKTITVRVVGKRNYTGEVAGENGISIPSLIPETPGTGGDEGSPSPGPRQPENGNDITAETTSGTITTAVVDRVRLETYIETAERGSGIVITISENDTSTAEIPLDTFETMAEREMTLTLQSGATAISIPSASIDFGAVRELFGPEAEYGDIPVSISISQLSPGETAALHSAAASEGLGILGTPVVFSVSASFNEKTVEVASFKQYVQRRFEVTQEIAENVSTALVFQEDNTFRPVPTSVCLENGKYYVIVASRTNSAYVLVSHTVLFGDTGGRWYEDVAKEMAGRQIIRGTGNNTFAGDREITRAEFAAIIVRALGLAEKGVSAFNDVPKDAWYNGAVAAAAEYEIVSGRGENRFDPMAKITREEAMQMVFNASKLTPFSGVEGEVNSEAFSDYEAKSQWAAEAVDFNLINGLIVGSNGKINPKANITRGETAAVVLRLLQEANLVNDRTEM
jgi:hypothetical protein